MLEQRMVITSRLDTSGIVTLRGVCMKGICMDVLHGRVQYESTHAVRVQ